MTDTQRCALPDCSRPATVIYRMRPRRDREPLCPEIKRATDWPGQSAPVSVIRVTHVEELVAVVVTEGEGE
jgi:hypothetical protein